MKPIKEYFTPQKREPVYEWIETTISEAYLYEEVQIEEGSWGSFPYYLLSVVQGQHKVLLISTDYKVPKFLLVGLDQKCKVYRRTDI